MIRWLQFAVIVLIFVFVTGCETWRPITSNRDPMFVHCKITGLIRWDEAMRDIPAVKDTLAQIKIHNASRRRNCPNSPVWYYDDIPAEGTDVPRVTVTTPGAPGS